MQDCIFCKIITGEIPCHKVYEDDAVLGFLDIHPVSIGHTLLVPKTHATHLVESTEEEAMALMRAIKTFAPRLMAGVGADGLNLSTNCGASAGQDVFHTHIHLMPRHAGVARSFEQISVTHDELQATAEKVRHFL